MSVSPCINAHTIWISDIHLGFKDCKSTYLHSFLSTIQCDTLFLVGDIVDLWSLKKRIFWPAEHYQILLKLYELANRGTRVVYIPGNHDDPLRHFEGQRMGPIEITREYDYETAKGKKFLVFHGDAMDAYMRHDWLTRFAGDIAYRFLLFLNRWSNRIRKMMGRPYFSLAGQIKENVIGARLAIQRYKLQCINEAKRHGYDGVICGHIHFPELDENDGFTYANTGDWVESCTALTEDYQGNFNLLHFATNMQNMSRDENQESDRKAA